MVWQIVSSGGSGNTDTVSLNYEDTSGNYAYGNVTMNSYKSTKEAGITNIAIPTRDSSQNLVLDWLGTTRDITIEGVTSGTGAQIDEFIGDLEDKIYGKQFSNTNKGHTLTVGRGKYKTLIVIIKSFTWDYLGGESNNIGWKLNMVEARST